MGKVRRKIGEKQRWRNGGERDREGHGVDDAIMARPAANLCQF
jgi:hypothetical protein